MPTPPIKIVFAVSVINMILQTTKSTVFRALTLCNYISIIYTTYTNVCKLWAKFFEQPQKNVLNQLVEFFPSLWEPHHQEEGNQTRVKQRFSLTKIEKQSRWLLRSLMRSNSDPNKSWLMQVK